MRIDEVPIAVSLHAYLEPREPAILMPCGRQRDDGFGGSISLGYRGQRLGLAGTGFFRIDSSQIFGITQRKGQTGGSGTQRSLRPGRTPPVGVVPQGKARIVLVYGQHHRRPVATVGRGLAGVVRDALAAGLRRRAVNDPDQPPHFRWAKVEGVVGNIAHGRHPFVGHLETVDHVSNGFVIELWRLGFRRPRQMLDHSRQRPALPVDARHLSRRRGAVGRRIDLYCRGKCFVRILRQRRPDQHCGP